MYPWGELAGSGVERKQMARPLSALQLSLTEEVVPLAELDDRDGEPPQTVVGEAGAPLEQLDVVDVRTEGVRAPVVEEPAQGDGGQVPEHEVGVTGAAEAGGDELLDEDSRSPGSRSGPSRRHPCPDLGRRRGCSTGPARWSSSSWWWRSSRWCWSSPRATTIRGGSDTRWRIRQRAGRRRPGRRPSDPRERQAHAAPGVATRHRGEHRPRRRRRHHHGRPRHHERRHHRRADSSASTSASSTSAPSAAPGPSRTPAAPPASAASVGGGGSQGGGSQSESGSPPSASRPSGGSPGSSSAGGAESDPTFEAGF